MLRSDCPLFNPKSVSLYCSINAITVSLVNSTLLGRPVVPPVNTIPAGILGVYSTSFATVFSPIFINAFQEIYKPS